MENDGYYLLTSEEVNEGCRSVGSVGRKTPHYTFFHLFSPLLSFVFLLLLSCHREQLERFDVSIDGAWIVPDGQGMNSPLISRRG